MGGGGVLQCAAFFCMYNDLVTSTDPDWMQGAFDALTGLFDSLGLHTYVGKTVWILFRHCRTVRTQLEAAYKQWMMVEVLNYWDRQCLCLKFPYCGEDLMVGSLASHRQTHHGIGLGAHWDSPCGRTTYVSDIISDPIGAAGLPSQGV